MSAFHQKNWQAGVTNPPKRELRYKLGRAALIVISYIIVWLATVPTPLTAD